MAASVFTIAERSWVNAIFTEGQEETDSFNVTLNAAYGSTIFTEGTWDRRCLKIHKQKY